MPRKVCVVLTSSIHYSRGKLILEELRAHTGIELQIVVAASALLSNYGEILTTLENDGFHCDAKITMVLEGGNPVAMAKTAGVGIMEFTTIFDNLKPDVVLLRGDRYEVLSAAVAAAYLNIPIAHIEGGDVTGTIDESVRHAITKLAHIHFPTNEPAKKRILQMGERPDAVFNIGSPDIEFAAKSEFTLTNEYMNRLGVGDAVDITQPYLVVMQHPVTTEVGLNRHHVEQTLEAIGRLKIPTVWFWPNVDAGTDEVSKAIRVYREYHQGTHIRFLKFLPAEQCIALFKGTLCLVGNSSAGIKECSYLGVPAVNIGTRQNGRMRGDNVMDVAYDADAIVAAIEAQRAHGHYPSNLLYYQDGVSKKISELLATVPLYVQKKFYDG